MSAQEEILNSNNHLSICSDDLQRPMPSTDKEKWLQKYASQILMVWSHRQTPLGVACTYTDKIKTDLVTFYDDPLKRVFIEASY